MFFLYVFAFIGCSYVTTVSKEELFSLTKQWKEPKVAIWYYRGSDNDYHYFVYQDLGITRKYRIRVNELSIENSFLLTNNQRNWRVMLWGVHSLR